MIYLHKEERPSVVTINKDLVVDYKRQGDRLLVEIRRTLTKQLVFYKLYSDLQLVNNSFWVIIEKLLYDKYTDKYQVHKDESELNKNCNLFIRNMNNLVDTEVYEHIEECIDDIRLLIKKLVYIVENICTED